MKQLSKHLTFANAISCIALFIALSGAAYAAKTTLANKAVKTKNLANGSVTALKLRGGSVTNLKLANGAVTGPKIAPGAVGSTQIANGAVRSAALGGSVVTEGKLKNGAVTEAKIFNSAVTNSKLGPNAVATGKVQDGAITSPKLAASFLAQLVKNVSYVNKVTETNETNHKSVTAECSMGKQVIGGGFKVILGTADLAPAVESFPFVSADGKRTGWTATVDSPELTKTWALEAHAICAEF